MKRHKVMFMLQYGTRMEPSPNGFCMVYPPEGWVFRNKTGHPISHYCKTVAHAVNVRLAKL